VLGHMGRRRTAAILVACAGASAVLVVAAISAHGQDNKPSEAERTAALTAWDSIVTVLQHPRCMNCHQENIPLQGDERRIHIPLVVRGPKDGEEGAGEGVGAMRCRSCHNVSGNNETSGTPGGGDTKKERWRLALSTMAWQGRSSAEICNALKDPKLNDNMSGQDLLKHMSSPLVMWGWKPGDGRTPIPMPHNEFMDHMMIWVAGGMACPD
jgi:hypothetical protein